MQGSLPTEQIILSSRCVPSLLDNRRLESVTGNRSANQYINTTRFFASSSMIDDSTTAGGSVTMRSSVNSPTTSFKCRSFVDEDAIPVNWASLWLLFVVLDVLLLVHRLTKLYVELDRMRLSAAVGGGFLPLSDCCADGVSALPVDGVDPGQTIAVREPAVTQVPNYVGSEALGVDDNDGEVDVVESTTNSLCVMAERCASNSVNSVSTRRYTTGSRCARRRRTRSSPNIVPRLICLVALLVALFYARMSTMSRGVMWLRSALPSPNDNSPPIFTSAFGRHFYDDVGVDSLSNDFRQLQAFVDFFNRGKSAAIFHGAVSISELIMYISVCIYTQCIFMLANKDLYNLM